MSRRFYFFIFLVLSVITVAICLEPLAIGAIRKELKNKLAAETVQIGHFELKSLGEVRLTGILVEKKGFITVKAREARVGFQWLKVLNKEIESLVIEGASVDYEKLHVENLFLRARQSKDDGQFRIEKITYDKAAISDIKSPVQMKGHELVFSALSANFLDGKISGEMAAALKDLPEFHAKLRFTNLSIERFVKDFDLRKKMEMTGTMDGELEVGGHGAEIAILGGDFKMGSPGGKLIIKDRRLLENIVQKAFLDTAIETLQDYHYNAGGLQLSMEEKNLVADVNLDGKQGKRDFKIVYHR